MKVPSYLYVSRKGDKRWVIIMKQAFPKLLCYRVEGPDTVLAGMQI
jgi:hypothetical protein